MKCKCKILKVLSPSEIDVIKKCLLSVDRENKDMIKLGIVDKGNIDHNCNYLLSWGYDYFCYNDEKIDDAIKEQDQ